ncbi:MAG: hypothetical protein AB1704_20615 [Pseudomonadota bacterium]
MKSTVELHHLHDLREQLGDMERSLRVRRTGGRGPRGHRASLVAVAVFSVAYAATLLAAKVGAEVPTGTLWRAFGVALLVMWLGNKYGNAPRTYTGKLTAMLRAYDPVEVEAYLDLEKRTQRFGMVESDILYNWIQLERCAVYEAVQRCSAYSLTRAVIDRARGK